MLLLRGPQTPGELRGRTERLHRFDEIADVLAGLQKLMEREPPLAAVLPRQPGTKESRYAHLLSGEMAASPVTAGESARAATYAVEDDRIAHLESEVAELRKEVAALRAKIDDLFGD